MKKIYLVKIPSSIHREGRWITKGGSPRLYTRLCDVTNSMRAKRETYYQIYFVDMDSFLTSAKLYVKEEKPKKEKPKTKKELIEENERLKAELMLRSTVSPFNPYTARLGDSISIVAPRLPLFTPEPPKKKYGDME